jgi:hypothetical protein
MSTEQIRYTDFGVRIVNGIYWLALVSCILAMNVVVNSGVQAGRSELRVLLSAA